MASRSLGTLTLDLIARTGGFEKGMDAAARASKKRMGDIKRDAKLLGTAIAGMATGVAASLALMNKEVYDSAQQFSRLASISNTSVQEFQKGAAAAKLVGVDMDGLSDVYSDLSEKVGDFLETGAGPLADFFENIAPQAGVTAEEFKKLSGPQGLELYFSALEKANLDQSQMLFYLKEINDQAPALAPLLRDGAKGFKELGDQAGRAGAILDENTINAAKDLQAAMYLLDQSTEGFRNRISAETLPIVASLAEAFTDLSTDGAIASELGQALATSMEWIAKAGLGAVASVHLLGKSMGALAAAVDAAGLNDLSIAERMNPAAVLKQIYKGFGEGKAALSVGFEDVEATLLKYGSAIDKIGEKAGDKTGSSISRVRELLDMMNTPPPAVGGSGSFDVAEAAKAQAEELDKLIESASASTAEWRKAKDEAAAALDSVTQSLMSEEEAILASYLRRRDIILQNTEDTSLKRKDLLARLEQQTNDQLTEINGSFWEKYLLAAENALTSLDDLALSTVDRFSSGIGDALEGMIFDAETAREAFQQLGEGMARSIVNALGKMAAEWVAYSVVQQLVGKSTATSAASTLALQAQAMAKQAELSAFASTAAIPIVGPPAAPGAASAAAAFAEPLAASVGALAFAGAFDKGGTIPDGSFGIVGERGPEIVRGPAHVTSRADTAKMLGGGDVTVNLVEDASKAGQVQKTPRAGGMDITAFVSNIRDDGVAARALEQTYGLKRVGT